MRHTTCKLKMARCSWNVVKSDNSCNLCEGGKRRDFFLW